MKILFIASVLFLLCSCNNPKIVRHDYEIFYQHCGAEEYSKLLCKWSLEPILWTNTNILDVDGCLTMKNVCNMHFQIKPFE